MYHGEMPDVVMTTPLMLILSRGWKASLELSMKLVSCMEISTQQKNMVMFNEGKFLDLIQWNFADTVSDSSQDTFNSLLWVHLVDADI